MVRDAPPLIFADRDEAGRLLGHELARRHLAEQTRPLVLALPRGGVPVAVQVAARLGGDLDIVLARKIGAPGQPEFGVGALAENGPPVFDEHSLGYLRLTPDDLAGTVAAERLELERRARRYRAGRPAPITAGRTVILVDDGLATGVTARAALRWLRGQGPHRTILAVPVCAPQAREALSSEADEIVYLSAPPGFHAVGQWYDDFGQLTDEDVDAAIRGFASA
ncbi:phosphoribosyltransferase family protein [Actinoplanes sp. KI2]|uniref:phosphoribosyltransferase n=1 Tax=Actinoplanes sp. KI2 TaxID=2983315 RepID=UPI0021D59838|nr:phosphoribosyltransferase family protein [Actinoplanes sp. KI2]MCU7727024.1 phosphoribosyltransferase family protein [Actinoplanes sp. KI2]